MLEKFFDRDRLVMAGLVVLGILTVTAGFASGRATFQYALSTDARQASTQWVKTIETKLFRKPVDSLQRIGKYRIVVSEPSEFAELRKQAQAGYSRGSVSVRSVNKESGLLGAVDMMVSGWISRLTRFLDDDMYVSQVRNFALLDVRGTVLLRTAGLEPGVLHVLLSDSTFQSELHKAIGLRSTRFVDRTASADGPSSEFRKTLIMPILSGDDTVNRVYLLEIDQTSAATMSKVALIAASLMTSLLIVLGYSIPAAVAFRRIRERWKAEDQIRFLAMHDPLTGLSNRVQLQMRLEEGIVRATRRGHSIGLMCIDLDRFKEVNDTLGHKAGDSLLVEVANRLRQCVRETDTIARLGGDEFVVIAEELEQPSDAIPVARRICQKLAEPAEIEGHKVAISGSVGITFAPAEGSDIEGLLNNADLALYRAKNDGRNTFRFFEPEMDEAIQNRRTIAAELRQALRNDGLHLQYQPHFDLKSGRLTGYEALARWTHPERGDIPPGKFIPIAEESGLIGMLGEWVLHTACGYARHWPAGTTLSVNISPAQFAAQDLAAAVRAALAHSGLSPDRLLLEFTEDLLLRKTDETIDTLQELTGMGVRLAIDNFGSGYSSLAYLTRLPVSKIKIDQSYIRDMETSKDASAIVKTIVGIGHSLDVTIVAEGVETQEQASRLRDAGCGEVQGYFFGRPAHEIRKNADGTPVFAHQAEVPGRINDTVPIDTDYPNLPLVHDERVTSVLSGALRAEPDPDHEIARYLADAKEDVEGLASESGPPAAPERSPAEVTRLRPEFARQAG